MSKKSKKATGGSAFADLRSPDAQVSSPPAGADQGTSVTEKRTAPNRLKAEHTGNYSIQLQWEPPVNDNKLYGYLLERSPARARTFACTDIWTSVHEPLPVLPVNTTEFDVEVEPYKVYNFCVRSAFRIKRETIYSDRCYLDDVVAKKQYQPFPPRNIKVTNRMTKSVSLAWLKPLPAADVTPASCEYVIEICDYSDGTLDKWQECCRTKETKCKVEVKHFETCCFRVSTHNKANNVTSLPLIIGNPEVRITITEKNGESIKSITSHWPVTHTTINDIESGSVVFVVSCQDMSGLRELWMNCRLGKLKKFFKDLFTPEASLASEVSDTDLDFDLRIDSKDFQSCRQHLKLTQDTKRGFRVVNMKGTHLRANTQQTLSEDYPVYCKPLQRSTSSQLDFLDPAIPTNQLGVYGEMAYALDLQSLQELAKFDDKLSILLPSATEKTEKPISNVRLPDIGFHESVDCKNIVAKAEEAHSLVVSGPTGSGKTQGVLAYAQKFAEKNMNAIMWFFGRSENEEMCLTRDTILQQGMQLAKKLEVNLTPEELPNKVMESLHNRQSKSLMIFDDVTATAVIPTAYLAASEKVTVVITTRSANLYLSLPKYNMTGFTKEDALRFLKRQDKKSMEMFKETSDDVLLKLANHFGNLPHGLSLARSYLLHSHTPVEHYLHELEERSKGTLYELKEHERPVYGGILMSIQNRMSKSSQDMLKFMAMLSQDRIPVFVLSKALEIASGENPDKDEFIKELEELSLARVEGRQEKRIDGRMISVHQLTQVAIMSDLDEQQLQTMTKSLIQTFLEYFHKDTRHIKDGYINDLLLPHVEAVLRLPTISNLPEKFHSGLARLHETVGYMYCQKCLPEIAVPALERAKEMICTLVPLDTDADSIFKMLFEKGRELYNKGDIYSKSLKERVLTLGDLMVLKTKVPKLSDEFSNAAMMGKPLTEDQYQQLVELQLAYDTDQIQKSFLIELTATILYTSARRIFYLQGEERVQYMPTADKDLNLSLALSRKLADEQGVQILNEMLSQRAGTLYLLKETDGKSPEQQRTDFLQAIAGYQDLIDDENDYFENGVLKKIGDDDFHRMHCYRAIVHTYHKLFHLAATDQERAEIIHLHEESAKKMVEFGEKQVKKDHKGNVIEEPEMMSEIYNIVGDFLIEMMEMDFLMTPGMDKGTTGTEDGNPLERARQWYNKALNVKSIKPHHEAVSRLGLAKVYTLMYEAERSKAAPNITSATNKDTQMDGIEEKIPLVENQRTLDEIHHLKCAKAEMNKCLEIYEEILRNRTRDIQEAKKWNDRIVRYIDSLAIITEESYESSV